MVLKEAPLAKKNKKRKSQPRLPVPNNVPMPSVTTLLPDQVIVADKNVGKSFILSVKYNSTQ